MGGGGEFFEYPKGIWSPTGGFWSDPKGWRKNTALAAAFIVAVSIPAFIWSSKNEVYHRPPKRWIPSMMWKSQVPPPTND